MLPILSSFTQLLLVSFKIKSKVTKIPFTAWLTQKMGRDSPLEELITQLLSGQLKDKACLNILTMTRFKPFVSIQCFKHSHPAQVSTLVCGCLMDKALTRLKQVQSAVFVTGLLMAKSSLLVFSMEPSKLKIRLVVNFSPSTSAKNQFGHLLSAPRNLRLLITY